MQYLRLFRYAYTPDYTEGALFLCETDSRSRFLAWTIERPYRNNEPEISAIPSDVYLVSKHRRPNGDDCFILQGRTVGLSPDDLGGDCTRWGILFHSANRPDEIQGCIAPGLDRKPGRVNRSRDAMAKLRREIYPAMNDDGEIGLIISQTPDPSLDQQSPLGL